MKLYQLDGLESHQYQDLIQVICFFREIKKFPQNICARLSIESVERLDEGLDKIESVILLLPQLEHVFTGVKNVINGDSLSEK